MARRRKPEEHENHERWLVSYADFITLLFAFFVVMYALSSINEGKYRILSESLNAAFRNVAQSQPGQVMLITEGAPALPVPVATLPKAADDGRLRQRDKMRNMAKEIMEALAPLVRQGKVRVLETSRGVTVEINDSILFAPGQATLEPLSVAALQAVARVVADSNFPITIEGHTDNVPIRTAQFPSNWELSAVRATTVLRLFAEAGVNPDRLTAIGYGEQRPVEPNDSVEGRARNRRVTILIDSFVPELPTEVGTEMRPNP
ncbi:flagellar motor protein MotD [Azovibrio restrictus]|jgi:chemotaxis protein MotB|uniref:flagellar motor protein MotD n=1 Tax=Azovibrio restrictus TaxID=146938 RepID=UPI0026F34422|nr:flagellar motor protein MotD [Azovibrio restrictus]